MNDTSPILEVRGVSRSFGGLRAVDRCSLSVSAGSITGLIGPNGAGKTTLFNLVTGSVRLTAGQVLFEGQRIDHLAAHQIFRRGLMRTFQIPRQFASMSVLENLMVVPMGQVGEHPWGVWFKSRKVARQEREWYEKAEGVLDFVGLSALKYEYSKNLSGGQKKLLELGRTLMAEPTLVLLDEPTAGVNPTLARQLVDNVERLRSERGITFLIIEHDMETIARLCDRVLVMSEGRLLTEGTPSEVVRNPAVLEAYLGPGVAEEVGA
jgi:branched-chain amino acid transport system ATP-binding protein